MRSEQTHAPTHHMHSNAHPRLSTLEWGDFVKGGQIETNGHGMGELSVDVRSITLYLSFSVRPSVVPESPDALSYGGA